jgi:hypothetical protein
MKTLCLMGASLMLAGNMAAADGPATVMLKLVGGVAPAEPGDQYTRDMELELTLRDGKFEPKVWGYAVDIQKCDHEGEIVRAEGDQLTIKLTLLRDAFGLRNNRNPLGSAEYQITLKRDGDRYTGAFTGKVVRLAATEKKEVVVSDSASLRAFLAARGQTNQLKPEAQAPQAAPPAPPAPPADQTVEVKGQVVGRAFPSWTEPVVGFKKLEPNEHPRLIFRKSDLPLIKKRLETPEGQAIMARFLEQLPKQHADNSKNQPFFPAGYGLAYQLTGDKAHAEKAKAILTDMLGLGGAQDIHYGPIAQAMAVTLDFCYDAWDAEFRQTVIDNLAGRMRNLETLTGMGGASLNPWHNHEAVRAAGAGVAAICLLGEKTSDGKEIAGLERIIHSNARSIRRFFEYNGNSNTGWGMEGNFYKRMTWNSGPGNVIQAYRAAFGGDMMQGIPGQWCVLGEWMWQPPAAQIATAHDLGDHQSAGLWPIGLVTVPDSMKAGARWLYDHAFGLEGTKTFGIHWAYHAGYVLMNYPFDVPAKPPGESLPWVGPDPVGGHWLFRKPWQGAQDSLVVLNTGADFPVGTHWIIGNNWDMQLFALGKLWVGDRVMNEKSANTPGAALPTTANAGAYTMNLGARLLAWNSTPDGRASLAWDNSPIYMSQLARDAKPGPDQKLVRMSRLGQFVDHGIRATRYVAMDLSGACGAPVLLAILDQSKGAKDVAWNLKLAKEAGAAKVEGNTVTVGDPAGANMKVTFVGATAPTLTPAIKATGSDQYYAIITVQNGPAPALKVDGDGATAKITVGNQSLRFDGQQIQFEK